MSWVYTIASNHSPDVTFSDAENSLNKLTAAQNASAKVATSDDRGGDAHAYVFWDTDAPTTPPDRPAGPSWSYQTFTDPSYDTIARQAADYLSKTLDSKQAYYAQITANDHHDHDPALILWFLEDKQ